MIIEKWHVRVLPMNCFSRSATVCLRTGKRIRLTTMVGTTSFLLFVYYLDLTTRDPFDTYSYITYFKLSAQRHRCGLARRRAF
jgi:hypothetical protein